VAGHDADEVKGINNFYINKQGQIETNYCELNSAAWLYNLGQPECQPDFVHNKMRDAGLTPSVTSPFRI